MARLKKGVTKTAAPKNTQLVVQELNIMSADRSVKGIDSFRNARESALSIHNPNMVRLYDLYDDVLLDGHLTGLIQKRKDAAINKGIYYADAKGKKIDAFDTLIESEEFREMLSLIMDVKLHGRSGLEFIPGAEFKFNEIPRKHIKQELEIISYEQHGVEGMSYKGVSNWWIIGKPKDLGLLLKCSPYTIYKRGNWGDWAQYVEIFGQPVRVIKYDAYDHKTKMELKTVMDEAGSSLAIMIPKQADFEMKDGKQSNGDGKLQDTFKDALNSELSILILGNSETTASSKSSGYAQAKEHGKQQFEITKSDIKDLRSKLNSPHFLNIVKSYGYPVVEGGGFVFEKEFDLAALKDRIEIDMKVSEKVPVADDYFYENYGVPKPDNYDELKAKQEAARATTVEPIEEKKKTAQKETKNAQKAAQKKLKDDTLIFKIRKTLADFFDHARSQS